MKTKPGLLLLALLMLLPSIGIGAPAGWIIEMGWSPEYCQRNLSSKELQCRQANHFLVDGLLPDSGAGPIADCDAGDGIPPEKLDPLLLVIPNAQTLRRLWRQQGACSGLSLDEYFVQVDHAARFLRIPADYRGEGHPEQVDAQVLRRKFIDENPGLTPEALRLSCRGRWLEDVRVCVDPSFGYRDCGVAVEDDCDGDVRLRQNRPGRTEKRR